MARKSPEGSSTDIGQNTQVLTLLATGRRSLRSLPILARKEQIPYTESVALILRLSAKAY